MKICIAALAFLAVASAIPRHVLPPPSLPKIEGLDMYLIHLPRVPIPVVDITPHGATIKFEEVSIIETPKEPSSDEYEFSSQRKKRSIEEPIKTARFVESADGVLSFVPADEASPAKSQFESVKFVDSPVKTARFVESADGVLSFVPAGDASPALAETVKVVDSPVKTARFVESADGILSFVPAEESPQTEVAAIEPVKTARFVESADGVLSFVSADEASPVKLKIETVKVAEVNAQESVSVVESADDIISFEPIKTARFVESADGVLSFVPAETEESVRVADSPIKSSLRKESIRVVESADGVISFETVFENVAPVPIQMRN